MKYDLDRSGDATVVALRNDLSFADRAEFLSLLPQLTEAAAGRSLVVDLKDLRFIDSAGMGMLLTLKDAVEKAGGDIRLREPKGGVATALRLASFGTLFTIDWEPARD